MGDALMTVVAILVSAILLFIVPMMAVAERNDDIGQVAVQTATASFTEKIALAGAIKQSDYEQFLTSIAATGNTYDVEIEVQHLDENPGKKSAMTSGTLIGESLRFSTYTTDVLEKFDETGNPPYPLKRGDIVIVTVKNTNITLAQTLRTFFYKVVGKDTSQIVASSSSMVTNTGR